MPGENSPTSDFQPLPGGEGAGAAPHSSSEAGTAPLREAADEPGGARTLLLGPITADDVRNLSLSDAELMGMRAHQSYSATLRKACEWLMLLGCVHLGIFPDWWNGLTDIMIAVFLSTALFRSASLANLVSVILVSLLNAMVQFFAIGSLVRMEVFEQKFIEDHGGQAYFVAYLLLIAADFVLMLVTASNSTKLLKEVYRIIVGRQQGADDSDVETGLGGAGLSGFGGNGNNDLESGLLNRPSNEPRGPLAFGSGGAGTPVTPFQGQAFKLPD